MDSQIIRQVIQEYIALSVQLGINEERCKVFEALIQKLPSIKIGRYGQIMEWYKDYNEVDPGHRHISQFFGLYPPNQITLEHTPELF